MLWVQLCPSMGVSAVVTGQLRKGTEGSFLVAPGEAGTDEGVPGEGGSGVSEWVVSTVSMQAEKGWGGEHGDPHSGRDPLAVAGCVAVCGMCGLVDGVGGRGRQLGYGIRSLAREGWLGR